MSPASTRLGGSSGNNELGTPHYLYDWAERRFGGFTYDAMASHENHLARQYSTIDGTFVCAGHDWLEHSNGLTVPEPMFVSFEHGLEHSWRDERVWINPPFGRGLLLPAVRTMVAERNNAELIAALVKVDTSTAWWRLLEAHAHIEWLPRVQFVNTADPNWPAATFPCALAILIPDAPRMPTRRKA